MRSSLTLQRSLFQHQQRQIDQRVQGASRAFRAYEARYRRATRAYRRVIDVEEVHERIAAADVVHVGDYHTLRLAQQTFLELVHRALKGRRRVALALEFVEGRHQPALDAFLAGRLKSRAFLERIGHPYRGPFDIWPGFEPILTLARRHRLEVVAVDRRAEGPRSLELRDAYAAERIAKVARAGDRPLVLSLIGQFHVAPGHIPRQVARALGDVERRQLIVYQNAEGAWWRLAKAGLAETARAVEVSDDELCVFSASPVVCQRSFLDYVEAESGDAPLTESGLAQTFRLLAKDIGRLTGVKVGPELSDITVLAAGDLDALEQLRARGRFTPRELGQLERHVLSRESAWVPRARAAWLASLSLNHAAEEAAHCVRFLAVGDAMQRERSKEEAFWARCLEEALGFFGSRLVNPARRCTSLEDWAAHFQRGTGEAHRAAAFVLAITAALPEEPKASRALWPRSPLSLFNGVSHALGYLLGDALARAFSRGQVSRAEVRELFEDRFEHPHATFRAWSLRLAQRPARRAA
ncbi:MAG: ChaN family lipoprotein [Myxococcales bacterium]|nr:ChaN family lipoprotein [Myxococcales bacterium]